MKNLCLALFISLCLISCGDKSVDFSSSNQKGLEGTSSPSDSAQGPKIKITRYPDDHLLGDGTQIAFEVIPGAYDIADIHCYLDGNPLDCETKLLGEGLRQGEHLFRVEAEDVRGLTATNQATWTIYSQVYQRRKLRFQVNSESKVDVLFVVDNSKSMHEEQKGIASRITSLFSKINGINWRLGIITTDPYERVPGTGRYNPLADGALLRFPNGKYHLKVSDGEKARKLFAATIYRPEEGNGHERGIRNTYRAIERSLNPANDVNQRLHDFFRSDASLVVIVISDENETLLDGNRRPLPDQQKSEGANLDRFIQSSWPEKDFQFNSIIVLPAPNNENCGDQDTKVGKAYAQLSQDTGGMVESICASDYGQALDNIGLGIVNLKKSYQLNCDPMDINQDGQLDFKVLGPQGYISSGYALHGSRLIFDQFLSIGNYEITYFCQGDVP